MEAETEEPAQRDMQFEKERLSDILAKGVAHDVDEEQKELRKAEDGHVNGPSENVFSVAEENYAPNHEAQQQHVRDSRNMSALEIGMYVLLAIFCLAISVFAANCAVFVYRYRRKRLPHERNVSNVQNAGDWVWIGRSTLERNSIQTDPITTLIPSEDFNGNPSPVGTAESQPVTPTGTGPVAAAAGGGGSNRNSYISTYKGSECSIRITANPLTDASPPIATTSHVGSTTPDKPLPPPPPPQLEEEDEDMEIEESEYEDANGADSDIDATNNNAMEASASCNLPPEVQWDYEAMGLTYDQLMEYFDNLKESTA